METRLMNFGDNIRVVSSSDNKKIQIGIGEIKIADVHQVHFDMIRRGFDRETLIVVPMDAEPTKKLSRIMELLEVVNTEEMSALTRRFHAIVGVDTAQLRPNRGMMRVALREIAREEVKKTMAKYMSGGKVNIREEGDEITRQEAPAASPPPPPAKKDKTSGKPSKKDGKPKKSAIPRERL